MTLCPSCGSRAHPTTRCPIFSTEPDGERRNAPGPHSTIPPRMSVSDVPPGPVQAVPGDPFGVIVGHEAVKEIFTRALGAAAPVHVLLVGPPATAKTVFLEAVERTFAGQASFFQFSRQPRKPPAALPTAGRCRAQDRIVSACLPL